MVDGDLAIEALPDDVLLQIFSLFNPRGHADKLMPPETWEWHKFAHVCQRWRRLVFAFPRYLGLALVTGRWGRRCVRTLDCWPALPIAIQHETSGALSPENEDDVIAGLKHSELIYEIKLPFSYRFLEKSATLAWSFPQLERLEIISAYDLYGTHQVPRGFLGGSTPTSHKLRHIELARVIFPSLPELLWSNRKLVYLYLGREVLIGEEYIPSDVLASSLSAATQLEYLHVYPGSLTSNLQQRRTHSASSAAVSPDIVLLPSLVDMDFLGPNEYVEGLVSRFHAPLLRRIRVGISPQGARPLDLPELCQFLSKSECLRSLPFQTSISIDERGFEIVHDFGPSPPRRSISLNISFYPHEPWDVSRVVHFSRQLSPLMSGVKRLTIQTNGMPPSLLDESDTARWLQLFMPFNGAQEVQVCNVCRSYDGIADALHESTVLRQEVFPALRILWLCGFGKKLPQGIKSFVSERQRTHKTVTVLPSRNRRRNGSESDVESLCYTVTNTG